jgi:hypothetical protein
MTDGIKFHLKTAFARTGLRSQTRLLQMVTRALAELSSRGAASIPIYQCARKSASTVVAPEMIDAMTATDGTTRFGSSRLTSDATKIAVTGNAITK